MKATLKVVLMVAALLVLGAAVARADTLTYTLTEQGVSTPLATWTMSSTPTPDCPNVGISPCYALGDYFGLDVDVYLNGSSTPTLDSLIFFNTSGPGSSGTWVVLNDTGNAGTVPPYVPLLPELITTDPSQQLYTGSEADPQMVVPADGSFTFGSDSPGFQGDVFTLSVVSTPEPGTIAMLGLGLAGLLFLRKRQLAL